MANSIGSTTQEETRESLFSSMDKYYVDEDGKIILEAVDLGMAILTFYDAIFACLGKAAESDKAGVLNHVSDYFLSLVLDNFTMEGLSNNKNAIDLHIQAIKEFDEQLGLEVDKATFFQYKQILENPFFASPAANIILAVVLVEAITRICNVYVYTYSKYKDPEGAAANYRSIHHPLAKIAFLCHGNHKNYYDMNLSCDRYARSLIEKK